MATAQPTPSSPGSRVRLAISSPEILAHIRREFAIRGLHAQIEGLPVVEMVVTPGPEAAAGGGAAGAVALGDALSRMAGPDAYRRDPATARYRLALVPNDQPRRPAAEEQRRAAANQAYAESLPPREEEVLSPRETEVMESISRGMRNPDIAALLMVSEKTVKNHVNRIFTKLGARSRVEAVLIWQNGTGSAP
jgi:DNA-binding CsgD family transcriptional regulator